MSHRTRYFLIGSVVVMSAVLCTGLVAYYNGTLPLRSSSVGPAELVYLPTNTTALAYANVQQIMASDFRQKIKQVLPTGGEEKDRLLAELGLDIERDIDSVVAGVSSGEPAINGAMVLVRGKFNTVAMEALAIQHGARAEDYKGKRLILSDEIPNTHTGTSIHGEGSAVVVERFTGCVAFLEPGLIALGDAGAIRRGIDASISHEDATKNTELMKFVADAENGSNAWAIGRFDEMTKSTPLPSEIRNHLPAVNWFLVSAHVNGGVTGRVRAEARDEESAQQLRAVVNGALAAGQLVAGRDSRLDGLLKSMQVTGTGTSVAMSFGVPPELLDMINGAAGFKNLMEAKKAPREISK
jgi:hypothetical protein